MAERAARRRPWLGSSVLCGSAVVLAWAAALALALWSTQDDAGRAALLGLLAPRAGVVLLFVLLLPLLLLVLLRPLVVAWPRAAERLRDEVAIVGAHAGHEVTAPPGAAPELRELALALDGLARAHAALQADVGLRVADAQARLADETRRLAALMSELPHGVVVCNREGRVLLYNAVAAQLLAAGPGGAPLGLGRPLAGVVDGGALAHAWAQVQHRLAQGREPAGARFVSARRGPPAALLRAQMVPVRGEGPGDAGGYVLIVDDIARELQQQGRRDALLQRLTEGSRAALANLRAAAQTLQQYPAMDESRRGRFAAVIHDEAERLARQLDEALRQRGDEAATAWPREHLQVGDLAFALQQALQAAGGIECRFDGAAAGRWLEADSHALVQLLAQVAARIAAATGARTLELQPHDDGRQLRLDLAWRGAALDAGAPQAWEAAPLQAMASDAPSLREVLDRHGAELWTLPGHDGAMHRLCLQLPAAADAEGAAPPPPLRARPVAYDFDLFHQAGQTQALDDTPLAALSYTVFDTETTGLRPSEGDEIIAIGALRIVNQRLLDNEPFDRLSRPRRPVRPSAQAVHGIGMDRLQHEPPLEQVLPDFARFCEGTVLVAHNAAFDMAFLERARERCGVGFDQPVLDTLLLSSVLHQGHGDDEHALEHIAARLGVAVEGRHQALGDARVTAAVFLKLLPLLAERGIVTLGQARRASMESAHARERF